MSVKSKINEVYGFNDQVIKVGDQVVQDGWAPTTDVREKERLELLHQCPNWNLGKVGIVKEIFGHIVLDDYGMYDYSYFSVVVDYCQNDDLVVEEDPEYLRLAIKDEIDASIPYKKEIENFKKGDNVCLDLAINPSFCECYARSGCEIGTVLEVLREEDSTEQFFNVLVRWEKGDVTALSNAVLRSVQL